jgi:hypothetical protein
LNGWSRSIQILKKVYNLFMLPVLTVVELGLKAQERSNCSALKPSNASVPMDSHVVAVQHRYFPRKTKIRRHSHFCALNTDAVLTLLFIYKMYCTGLIANDVIFPREHYPRYCRLRCSCEDIILPFSCPLLSAEC